MVVFIVLIHLYANRLSDASATHRGPPRECSDHLNRTLFRLELRLCFWNGIHVVLFFLLCLFLRPVSIADHLAIFAVGVAWFLLQVIANHCLPHAKALTDTGSRTWGCPDASYQNVMVPKPDDFVYNTLGQLCYIVAALPIGFFASE
jgi:hypothetical protein